MPSHELIRRRIQERMRALGIRDFRELAERAEVSEATIERICDGRTPNPQQRTREKIARALGVDDPDEIFGDAPAATSPAESVFDEEGLYAHLEELLGDGDHYFFLGSPGYLHRHFFDGAASKPFRRHAVRLLQAGVRIGFVFPLATPGSEDSVRELMTVLKDYSTFRHNRIRHSFKTDPGAPRIDPSQLRLFFYDADWSELRPVAGAVIVTFAGGVRQTYLAARSASGTRDGDRDVVFVRIHEADSEQIWHRLGEAVVPVANPALTQNRLDSLVQKSYRQHTKGGDYLNQYKSVRRTVFYDERTKDRIASTIQSALPDRPAGTVLDVLEIGAGDMRASSELLYNRMGPSRFLSVTAVDSGLHSKDPRFEPKYLKPYVSVTYHSNELFEEWSSGGTRYDLVLAFHSLYLMDPIYVWKMVSLLKRDGVLAILHSPYEENGLSILAGIVDNLSEERKEPYPGKVVADDPWRVYAEDLSGFLEAHSGLQVQEHDDLVATFKAGSLFTRAKKFNKATGEQVVRFHAGGDLLGVDAGRVHRELTSKLTCVDEEREWYQHRERLFLITRPPHSGQWLRGPWTAAGAGSAPPGEARPGAGAPPRNATGL